MEYIEDTVLKGFNKRPVIWLRYIDDIFFVWTHGMETLEQWLKHLNNFHETIKFTVEHSKHQINFLDTTVKIDKHTGKLYTDLYRKPTDVNNYLQYDSAHPNSTKRSLPYSQLLRLLRICQRPEDFEIHSQAKIKEFEEKGYPRKILEEALEKVKALSRETTLQPKPKKEKDPDTTHLISTYRPGNNIINDTVSKNWDRLGKSKQTKFLRRGGLVKGQKRPKNLKDHLVRAATYYPMSDDEEEGVVMKSHPKKQKIRCTKLFCDKCVKIDKSGEITSKTTERKYVAKQNVTCESSNLIYCLECKRCKMQYVGKTERPLKERLGEHLGTIKANKGDTDVPWHFNQADHQKRSDVKIYVIEFINRHPKTDEGKRLLALAEYHWIEKKAISFPAGNEYTRRQIWIEF